MEGKREEGVRKKEGEREERRGEQGRGGDRTGRGKGRGEERKHKIHSKCLELDAPDVTPHRRSSGSD